MEYVLKADYHTHTVMSHGTGTAMENAQAAEKRGLQTIAISDHAPRHMAYGVRDLQAYQAEIAKTAEAYAGRVKVLRGIELNLLGMRGQTDMAASALEQFDIRILGYHKLVAVRSFAGFWNFYVRNYVRRSAAFVAAVTDAYIEAIQRNPITILAHPTYGIPVNIPAVAEACRDRGTFCELNNSHSELSPAIIEAAAKTGVQFVLSSDAHCPGKVGQVEGALKKARMVGLGEREIVNIEPAG